MILLMLFVIFNMWALTLGTLSVWTGWSQRILQKGCALFSKRGLPGWFEFRLQSCMKTSLQWLILRGRFSSTTAYGYSQKRFSHCVQSLRSNRPPSCSLQGQEEYLQSTLTMLVSTFGSPLPGYSFRVVTELCFLSPHPVRTRKLKVILTNAFRTGVSSGLC